ncbi:MAG TPA: amino acid adenylation domain-containing protein [Candidatus Acidoferrales bacterium]|nr:amino acid adenylation domain-containing protein [Candidatus Acidoferrales bacterium]
MDSAGDSIAIVGMAGRFPGARNIAEFWQNVRHGIEAVTRFREQDLEIPGAAAAFQDANYVPARPILADADLFDATFFGIYPKEAELMDPQQRIFLECCWEALEDGGCDPQTYPGAIAVFAGSAANTYFLERLRNDPDFIGDYTAGYLVGNYSTLLGTNADFLATRVSYKLNLRGPSFTMQAGCSTSLAAVCQACQCLLSYQADMALAGGVSVTFPQRRGYIYQDGGMVSPDGHCRTFDAKAQGTIFGSGAGVVLLKRLEEAIAEGDHIYAVIRGSAMNNDGAAKVGYTAPSVEGQAAVIAAAQASAGVHPDSIGYVEAHGTGTPLGDPIEVAALTRVFRERTGAKGFCAIGTVKTNIGHLDVASGVAGLINAANVVRYGELPPTLHFETPNPALDLPNSPFFVNTRLAGWKSGQEPRRAAVSAFGVGGTNAHVIMEEAPRLPETGVGNTGHLLLLSARSETALEQTTRNLLGHLKSEPGVDLARVAYTLQTGRRAFEFRRMLVCGDLPDAIAGLEAGSRAMTRRTAPHKGRIVFLFPGQGSQAVNMGLEVYRTEPKFRETVDRCAEILRPMIGFDLRQALYPDGAHCDLNDTALTQPALFVIEYALASLWMEWGIRPQAMIGHSVGEFVAACLAGVLTLEDALAAVAARGRMMQDLPRGSMLAVRLAEEALRPLLPADVDVAALNGPSLTVAAGPEAAIAALEEKLGSQEIVSRRLATSHAFHSRMMDPIVQPFIDRLRGIRLRPPQIPYISGVTGTWITDTEATDPVYWARHFREPVRFSAGMQKLRGAAENVLLEVGPGTTLATLARQHASPFPDQTVISSLPTGACERLSLLDALGRLWLAGIQPDWNRVHGENRPRRCPLPTYPFERRRYWIEAPPKQAQAPSAAAQAEEIMTETAPASTQPAPGRSAKIQSILVRVFEDLSGLTIAGDPSTSFLEMGFDSLFLTQVTQALQNKFGLKITFRQLMDRESTLAALADYVDANLPADRFQEEVPSSQAPALAPGAATSAASVAPVAPVASAAIEAVIKEQLQTMSQLMARQLEMLRGVSLDTLPAAAPIPAPTRMPVPAASSPEPPKQDFKPFGPYKPVQKGSSDGLTPEQTEHLKALSHRYTTRTQGSKKFTEQHRRTLADPRVAAGFRSLWKEMVYPIVTVRSSGSRLWDIDGNEYIDILNGFGPIMFGHGPEFVTKAVEQQLREGFEIGPQAPLAGKVADLLCEFTGMERATFCNTGSEAVMAALRVARTVTGRNKVVLFEGAYHGMFDEVLVKGVTRDGVPHSFPIAPGIPRQKVENVVVLQYGTKEALEWIRTHATELAAVLVEPVQSRHPALQPREFLQQIREITTQSGSALIFDEVVTGFRVHPGGAQAIFGIRADLATYGKVLAGGLPIGVLAGRAAFMDALDGGMWQYGDESFPEAGVTFFAGTFVRHPLALAAVWAVLNHLKEQGPTLQQRLTDKTAMLAGRLNEFFEQREVPLRIEHFGSIFYFSFPSDQRFGSLLYYHLREKGIHLLEGFPCFLTTAHTDEDVERVICAFQESVLEMQDGGMLPAPSQDRAIPAAAKPALPAEEILEAPVTEAQAEVWLSAQLGDDATCAFNESFTLRLHGRLNQPALRDSIQELVNRHQALRATFTENGERVRFQPTLHIDLPWIDLSSLNAAGCEKRMREIIREDARSPFDLARGPLVRAMLIRFAEEDHAVVFTTHHIICDGWSTNVLLDELSRLYTARCRGTECALPAPMPFGQYAREQAARRYTAEYASVETWWAEKYAGRAPVLELPTDRPRDAVKSFKGGTVRKTIGAETYRAIKRAGAQQGCTFFVTLLGGFQALLHRLSGQHDLIVGIPTAGQSLVETDALVGHCVNFLPVRARIESDTKSADLLRSVKADLLDVYEHQNYTYGSLVRKLGLPRDPSRLPLIEVQFNLERIGAGMQFEGLAVEVEANPKSFVNFDLFLNIVESDNGLVLDCDYNSDLYDEDTIARWLGHYETLLAAMAADASLPASKLPLLSEAERSALVSEWNATQSEFPADRCIHQLFEEQATRTPDAKAVVFRDEVLTYSELNARAERLAGYLRKQGVRPGVLVGLCVERSMAMLVGLLGILKAGGAYLPLDPGYPKERLAFILEDAAAPLLLTQESLTAHLETVKARLVCLDRDWQSIASVEAPPEEAATPQDLAYVIYTSGSTGNPKGVEISHLAVVNLLWSMKREPGIRQSDALLAITTLAFDIAGLEIFLPLIAGARLVIAPREALADGAALAELLAGSGATVFQATPATWRLLLEAGWRGNPALVMLCGGEALPRDLAAALLPRGASLWNMYGPTETTIWSSTVRLGPGNGPVPVGPPIANTEFYVLDAAGEPVPIGVPGELYIGGAGLARGYWNRPGLTAEKFVPHLFRSEPGARMYRTGDLVRYHANRTLEFLGRMDNQVKVRGYRIELEEIEAMLAGHAAVRECVVVVREDVASDKRLVAYVAAEPMPSPGELRATLAVRLPDYMIPSIFVPMGQLPRTPNGKIDRRSLPAPEPSAGRQEFVSPTNARERALAEICAEVLRLDRVSIDDNLFELGADSIHLFQISARAGIAKLTVTPRQILQHRTVGALAAALENNYSEKPAGQTIPVVRRERRYGSRSLV